MDRQAETIRSEVEHWLAIAEDEVRRGALAGASLVDILPTLRERSRMAAKVAETKASFAVLELNSDIIRDIATRGGSTHYRWETEQDERVRPNHEVLHDSIQSWDIPPEGGGTHAIDRGHPGSGWGCRCLAIPLAGPTLPANPNRLGTP